jgi:hypothetical protein
VYFPPSTLTTAGGRMSFTRQKELLSDLRDFQNKFSRDDEYVFQMAVKRQKDDEELDTMTLQKLEEMHKKYVIRKHKYDPNSFFKKP